LTLPTLLNISTSQQFTTSPPSLKKTKHEDTIDRRGELSSQHTEERTRRAWTPRHNHVRRQWLARCSARHRPAPRRALGQVRRLVGDVAVAAPFAATVRQRRGADTQLSVCAAHVSLEHAAAALPQAHQPPRCEGLFWRRPADIPPSGAGRTCLFRHLLERTAAERRQASRPYRRSR